MSSVVIFCGSNVVCVCEFVALNQVVLLYTHVSHADFFLLGISKMQ